MQMIHGLTQNCKTLREVLIKRKGQQSIIYLNPVTAFFCLLQFMFLGVFFPCKPVKEGRLQRWRSLPVIFMFFMFHFWRAVDFFCTKCTCLFSSPLPVLSRIHWDGDRGGGRAVSLPHPFYLLHHKKKKKKNHILSSFETRSRQFDIFFNFFF